MTDLANLILLIKIVVSGIALFVFGKLVQLWRSDASPEPVPWARKCRLIFTSFVANLADTVGLGSFAVVVAFDKHWELVDDKDLPGTLNAHSILAALLQSLFFLQVVTLDPVTLIALTVASSVGGFLGGFIVARVNKEKVRLLMLIGYIGMAALIIASKAGILPIGGELEALGGVKLVIGFVTLFFIGMLPAIGVGTYAPVQVVLFLLGMAPLAAFPIMTTSATIQQSVAALAFIMEKRVAIRAAMLMVIPAIIGVIVAAPFIAYVDASSLRWLLLAIVLYNVVMLYKSYRKSHSAV